MTDEPAEIAEGGGAEPVEAPAAADADDSAGTIGTVGDHEITRRHLLLAGGAAVGLGAAGIAGKWALERGEDAPTAAVEDERARELAETFAPTYFFDTQEQWFPTDPRPYESEGEDGPVVDGFDALEGYTKEFSEGGSPPRPTVFYNARTYEDSSLSVIQYWWYAAFDQFTVNFHWHDWEVAHVFVDEDTETAELFVASAHSRKVPNNEFLDPEIEGGPRILAELGSHSSGLSVNEAAAEFNRVSLGDLTADITNSLLEVGIDLAAAYGLPRGEGLGVPFVVPDLEGAKLWDHEDLPSVTPEWLITGDLIVESFEGLRSPPANLPERETGLVFAADPASVEAADSSYDLVSTSELEHLTAFTGPQLSFTFRIPDFVEDRFAKHLTTTGVPWDQPRYENPAEDISDPVHRRALSERYDAIGSPSPINRLASVVRTAESTDDAPEDEGLTTTTPLIEAVALVQSEPEAVPSTNGVVVAQDLPPGEHRLTINGAGVAPHSERVTVEDGGKTHLAGVEGRTVLAPNEAATKVEVEPDPDGPAPENLQIADDFAGRLYDAPLEGPDAAYVHQSGAFTVELRDVEGEVGAERVNPDTPETITLENAQTGMGSLAGFVADVSRDADGTVRREQGIDPDADPSKHTDDTGSGDTDDTDDDTGTGDTDATDDDTSGSDTSNGSTNAIWGLLQSLSGIATAADAAADRAGAGERGGAEQRLETAEKRIGFARNRLDEAAGDLADSTETALRIRLRKAEERTTQALDANTL